MEANEFPYRTGLPLLILGHIFLRLGARPWVAWGPRSPWLSAKWSSSASGSLQPMYEALTYTKLLPG